ncbi:hypothetical protein [Nocardia shimofusensis]|uniref:hypothetical protein n=1 Tax=Nocardia shimofusensis TaxID=228596 RepID=UPI00082E1216|nr:hypothetical protein [Nocardia shimofusensis]
MIRIGRVVRAAGALMIVTAVAGACADGAADDSAGSAGSSEAALRTAAQQWSRAIAEGDYPAAYRFHSARCRLTLGQEAYVEEMSQRYAGRDLGASEPDITVAVTGDTGQVTVRHTDERAGEDDAEPATWKYVDGTWRYDTC